MWIKLPNGNYVGTTRIAAVTVKIFESKNNWQASYRRVNALIDSGFGNIELADNFKTAEAAREYAAKFVAKYLAPEGVVNDED